MMNMGGMDWRTALLECSDRVVGVAVHGATEALLGVDGHLLSVDANERAISHRLARHLENGFDGWDVDCEYNRDRHDPKLLRTLPRLPRGCDGREVYPDVIVHRRNTDDNLLVIELKKTSNYSPDTYDRAKLRAYRSELGYRHALFMRLRTGTSRPDVAEVWWSVE